MPMTITVNDATGNSIQTAARLTGMTPGEVVERLVAQSTLRTDDAVAPSTDNDGVAVYNDYAGHRTRARFYPTTGRIEIADGPLSGKSAGTPSQAARLVISHYKPHVDPNRNGWTFWTLDDGSGGLIQSLRG